MDAEDEATFGGVHGLVSDDVGFSHDFFACSFSNFQDCFWVLDGSYGGKDDGWEVFVWIKTEFSNDSTKSSGPKAIFNESDVVAPSGESGGRDF